MNFDKMTKDRAERVAARRADPGPLIYVINCHHPISSWPTSSWHYVGRSMPRRSVNYTGSSLGNPYRVQDDASRDHALRDYKLWLWGQMKDPDSSQSQELARILRYSLERDGICLGCWCAPKSCHAGVVKAAVEWLWKEGHRPEGWTIENIR